MFGVLGMLAAAATAAAGCGAGGSATALERAAVATTAAPATTASPTTSAAPTTTAAAPAPTTTVAPTTTAPPREVVEQAWVPFATVDGVTLHHPSSRVERVAFHESNNDGARPMQPVATAVSPTVLESRDRGNPPSTAVDIVVDPGSEIRAPVTGTVIRAGSYVLYCDHRDNYVVIEPDARPGWEVKILHIDGLSISDGQRVVAGETVIAPRPRQLPFESQVDEISSEPAWPHTHLEVVDPTIPDRPGEGCP